MYIYIYIYYTEKNVAMQVRGLQLSVFCLALHVDRVLWTLFPLNPKGDPKP